MGKNINLKEGIKKIASLEESLDGVCVGLEKKVQLSEQDQINLLVIKSIQLQTTTIRMIYFLNQWISKFKFILIIMALLIFKNEISAFASVLFSPLSVYMNDGVLLFNSLSTEAQFQYKYAAPIGFILTALATPTIIKLLKNGLKGILN